MEHPKISIIIPSYNCAPYLRETIETILSQTCQDFEIILVNDGSSDNTEEVIAPYVEHIVYIAQANKGLPAALNRGLDVATGELIALLDADDLWDPEKLREQVNFLDQYPEVGLSFTNYTTFGSAAPPQSWFDSTHGEVWNYPHKQVSPHHYVITGISMLLHLLTVQAMPKPSSVVFRRECIQKAGPFDENLTFIQDTQMWLRMGKHFAFGFTDLCLLKRRLRDDSLATIQDDRRYVREHVDMLENLRRWIEFDRLEKAALDKLLAKYQFAAGYLDLSEYLLDSSRKQLWASFKLVAAPKTFAYLCLAHFPKDIVKMIRSFKQKRTGRLISSAT